MPNNSKYLVVLGAAESGIGAALLGHQQGWQVWVSDGGLIKENFKSQLIQAGIAFEEGTHSYDKILNADCVVKSPGIAEKVELMQKIRAANLFVCSEIEFAFQYKKESKIVAITGSNGKSTTTKLIAHTLQTAGFDVAMVGNIGYSFARQMYECPKAWYVIEISSFQLDDIHQFQPDIALLLNITPDHLDRYNYDFEKYIESKFLIAKNQNSQQYFIYNNDDEVITQHLDKFHTSAQQISFTMNRKNNPKANAFIEQEIMHINFNGVLENISINDYTLQGKHNQYNGMAAGISAVVAGIRQEKIRDSFASFEGLEHRLEFVATVKGVDYINDSKATNVNSVWYALESMKKPTVLILGGQDKGNDYTEIAALVKEKVKAIICMGMDNTPIHKAFTGIVNWIVDSKSAKEAVKIAYEIAEPGEVVLLAPACASFDLFKNYEDRGKQFKNAIKEL